MNLGKVWESWVKCLGYLGTLEVTWVTKWNTSCTSTNCMVHHQSWNGSGSGAFPVSNEAHDSKNKAYHFDVWWRFVCACTWVAWNDSRRQWYSFYKHWIQGVCQSQCHPACHNCNLSPQLEWVGQTNRADFLSCHLENHNRLCGELSSQISFSV